MTREESICLMIGDYVEYKTEQSGNDAWWSVANVVCVRGNVDILPPFNITLSVGDKKFGFPAGLIRPISLTTELLEKNGFVPEQVSLHRTHWTKECITIEQTVSGFLLPCGLNEDIDVSEFHKLQQAIRLINGKELIV